MCERESECMSERDDITCTQERAERLKDDALHLRTVAQLEQERSWTPVASGLSWLSRLVTTLGVHWPDSEVRAGDRWCHPGRQVVLSAAAAALPHLADCRHVMGACAMRLWNAACMYARHACTCVCVVVSCLVLPCR